MINTLELFSGTKSFSKVAKKRGFDTFTIDNNHKLNPDLVADLNKLDPFFIFKFFDDMTFLWASPPCQVFSVASIRHYWKDGRPKNQKTLDGITLLKKTIFAISKSKPTYWFIENPRGMMRKIIDPLFLQYGITNYQRHTITYCQYGANVMKPTDIWTNASFWKPRPVCKPGANCHIKAPRGSKTGIQGIKNDEYNPEYEKARGNNAINRGVIPEDLFLEIFDQWEKL